jgi:hypothetical protein
VIETCCVARADTGPLAVARLGGIHVAMCSTIRRIYAASSGGWTHRRSLPSRTWSGVTVADVGTSTFPAWAGPGKVANRLAQLTPRREHTMTRWSA